MEYRQFGRLRPQGPCSQFRDRHVRRHQRVLPALGRRRTSRKRRRLVDLCLDAGANFFDTADIYSQGASEEILGQALKGKRDQALISTKATFPRRARGRTTSGSSRYHLMRACEASLRRLGTDHIDVYFMHGFDALTPVDETLRALDDLVRPARSATSAPRTSPAGT